MPEKPISKERVIKERRFVPIKTYCETTGLSYATVSHLCKSGQLSYITTESGQRRIDTKEQGDSNELILKALSEHQKMLNALCRQLNTVV
jgi:predicted site-specific integrase-resolvase